VLVAVATGFELIVGHCALKVRLYRHSGSDLLHRRFRRAPGQIFAWGTRDLALFGTRAE